MSVGDYGVLLDIDKLAKLADRLLDAGRDVAFDLETGYASSEPDRIRGAIDWDWDKQFVVGFSFSGDPSWARYVPLRHDSGGNVEDEAAAWAAMKPLLTQGKITAHNERFEERGVLKAGPYLLGSEGENAYLEDTMLMAYALGGVFGLPNGIRASYGLKDLVQIIFKHQMVHIGELFPTKLTENQLKCMRFNVLDLNPQVVAYACEDAAWTLALRRKIRDRAQSERPMMFALEHQVSRIMAEVEARGIGVNWEGMHAALAQGGRFVPIMERAIKEALAKLSGRDVSAVALNSPKQMQELLYRDMGLSTSRMTASAEKKLAKKPDTPKWQLMSTDENAMKGLSKKHPAIKKLLEYREVLNMQGRLEKWTKEIQPYAHDGRAHASYRQAGTEDNTANAPGTGRFSAADPSIQQCPKEWRWAVQLGFDVWDDEDQWNKVVATGENGIDYWNGHFREFIEAAPGHYFLTFDFSQIELRVLAGVSQEPALLSAFERDVDVHKATAAQMLSKRVEDVGDKERQDFGKRLNFALLYQEGPAALAEQLGVPIERAKEMMAQYFAAFSRVSSWQEAAVGKGLRSGYAETCFGRRYEVWELKSSHRGIVAKGKRVLVNAPIQGGAADYMKIAMVRVTRELKERGWWGEKVMIVMNQHDSLTFECRDDMDPNEVRRVIEERVTFPVRGFPKIVADWELGLTWGGAEKWKDGMVAVRNGSRWELEFRGDEPDTQSVDNPVDEIVDEQALARIVAVDGTQVSLEPEPVKSGPMVTKSGSVVVHASRTPDRESFSRLLQLVASLPGETEVVLRCPAGEVPVGTSSLSMADSGRVSLILGGAMMTANASSEDLQTMASALTL